MKKYSEDFYVNRLVREWLDHGLLIVACDLDDTIIPYNEESIDSCDEVVSLLLECQKEGIVLILNTAREKSKHASSVSEVEGLGLNVASINETPDYLDLPFGRDGKVYANIFLDNRSGLEQSKNQLKIALLKVIDARE